jgi:hypothetical protein
MWKFCVLIIGMDVGVYSSRFPLVLEYENIPFFLLILSESRSKTHGDINTHTNVCKYKYFPENNYTCSLKVASLFVRFSLFFMKILNFQKNCSN